MARILVVDDDPGAQKIVQLMLRRQHDVTVAGTPDAACAAAQSGRFDAVLMDIALNSSLTGVEVMQRLRETWGLPAVPIIACTAYTLPGTADRLYAQGFDGFVAKPFSRSELQQALTRVHVT